MQKLIQLKLLLRIPLGFSPTNGICIRSFRKTSQVTPLTKSPPGT